MLSEGINVYSTNDLQHWRFERTVLRNTSLHVPGFSGQFRIERPKVLYNAQTRKYVMWFHLDDAKFTLRMVGVATCDAVAGDYAFVAGFQPDGQPSLDMGLFEDTDGTAYLVRSVNNAYAGFSKLTPDYLNSTGIISKGPRVEGQAVWRTGDRYYLWGSHLTGWASNPAVLATKSAPLADDRPWTVLGNPSGDAHTYHTQSTYVLPYTHPAGSTRAGETLHILLSDRWVTPGKTPASVVNASYVWLPLVANNASAPTGFTLPWLETWRIADY